VTGKSLYIYGTRPKAECLNNRGQSPVEALNVSFSGRALSKMVYLQRGFAGAIESQIYERQFAEKQLRCAEGKWSNIIL
jgi:hypothetical protein